MIIYFSLTINRIAEISLLYNWIEILLFLLMLCNIVFKLRYLEIVQSSKRNVDRIINWTIDNERVFKKITRKRLNTKTIIELVLNYG